MPLAWVFIAATALSSSGNDVVETARDYLGYPYVYGDEGTYGFDCSGFVRSVYARHGYTLPRTSRQQSRVGEPVAFDALRAGDLVFFTPSPKSNRVSHVGIATGDGSMIHASSGRGEVVIDPLTMRYWRDHRAEGRRILGTPFAELPTGEEDEAREHDTPLPATLGSSAKPSLWHSGPVDLQRRQTSLGVRALASMSDDDATVWLLAPTLELRSSRLDGELVAQFPIAWDTNGDARLLFEGPGGLLRILDRARIGSPDARLYFEASREVSLSLGKGSLVDGVTPMAQTRSLVGLPVRAGFAVATAYRDDNFGARLLADDIVAPSVLAARVESAGALRLGIQWAIDPNVPDGNRAAGGVSAAWDVLDQRSIGVALRGDASVFEVEQTAPALAAGIDLRVSPSPVELELGAEYRRYAPGAAPDLFGVDYRSWRDRGIWSLLDEESTTGAWQNALRVDGLLALTRRFAVRAAMTFADPGSVIDQDQLEVGLIAREWQLGGRWSLSAALSYHQRFVSGFGELESDRDLFFATARLLSLDGLSFGAQVAKRNFNEGSRLDGAFDVAYSLTF